MLFSGTSVCPFSFSCMINFVSQVLSNTSSRLTAKADGKQPQSKSWVYTFILYSMYLIYNFCTVGCVGRIMTSFICNNSFTYVLRIIILDVTERARERARGNNKGLSYHQKKRRNKIGNLWLWLVCCWPGLYYILYSLVCCCCCCCF